MKLHENHANRNVSAAKPATRGRNHITVNGVSPTSDKIEIELWCEAPNAEKVCVAGDFNRWRAGDVRLRRDATGIWRVPLWLAPGRYEYRFIVDGEWRDDPHAAIHVPNEFGSSNCVLEVRPLEARF